MKKIKIDWHEIGITCGIITFILSIIFIIICVIFVFKGLNEALTEVDKGIATYEANIGRQVVINKDTLLVVDASYFKSSYTLSNGLKVDNAFFDKVVVPEKLTFKDK